MFVVCANDIIDKYVINIFLYSCLIVLVRTCMENPRYFFKTNFPTIICTEEDPRLRNEIFTLHE